MISWRRFHGPLKPCRNAIQPMGRMSSPFWATPCGVSGVPQQWGAGWPEGIASLGYLIPAANAAMCSAEAKAPSKLQPKPNGMLRIDQPKLGCATTTFSSAAVALRSVP